MSHPKISIMSYSFHGLHNVGAMDLYGYLYSLKYRYHVNTADLWNGFIDSYTPDYVQKLKSMMLELDMEVAALCCDQAHVWDDDPRVRADNEAMALKCLEFAKALGIKVIRMDVGVRDSKFTKETLDYVVRKYSEYCAITATFGAKLGPENHWGCSRDPESLQQLFDRMAGVDNFGLQLHLGNWDHCDPNSCDLEFIKYAMHMHVDQKHCCDPEPAHLQRLMASGYGGAWSVESHDGKNEYANVECQLACLKQALKPNTYTADRMAVGGLIERTVPGFVDGLKAFMAAMAAKIKDNQASSNVVLQDHFNEETCAALQEAETIAHDSAVMHYSDVEEALRELKR